MGHRPVGQGVVGWKGGGGGTDWGLSVMCSPCLGGKKIILHPPWRPWGPPIVPISTVASPQLCLQALGQLRFVADGAGPAVHAVVITGQAAGSYLAIGAAVGQSGSGRRNPRAPLCPAPAPQCPGLCWHRTGPCCAMPVAAGSPGWAWADPSTTASHHPEGSHRSELPFNSQTPITEPAPRSRGHAWMIQPQDTSSFLGLRAHPTPLPPLSSPALARTCRTLLRSAC